MAETDVGILIKAVDQATATLRVVSDEVRKLEIASGKAAIATSSFSKSQTQLGAALDAVKNQLARHSPALAGLSDVFDAAGKASVGAGGAIAGASVAVIAIGAAAVVAANSIGHYQERMDLAAQATGLTQEQIGGLTVAASNVGLSFESIQPSLTIFSRKIFEARAGSKNLEIAFATLSSAAGHTIDVNASVSDLFGEVAQSINKIPDPADRAKVAFELFGRSGIQMLGILSQDLTEAEKIALRLGITLSADMQKVARDADAAGDRLKLTFTGLGNTIMLAFAPLGTFLENAVGGPLAKLAAFLNSPEWKLFSTSKPLLFGGPTTEALLAAVPKKPGGPLSRAGMPEDILGKEAMLTAEQKKQFEVTEELIRRQAELVSFGAIKLEQEIKTLEASRSNVLSERELNELESNITALKAQQLEIDRASAEARLRGAIGPGTFVTKEAREFVGPIIEKFVPRPATITEGGVPTETRTFVNEMENARDAVVDVTFSLDGTLGMAAKSIDVMRNAAFSFASSAGRAASDVILRGRDIAGAFSDVMKSLAESIITNLVQKISLSLVGLIGGIFAAPVGGFSEAGPAFAQRGGTLGMMPLGVQSGVVISGIRGSDTVPLLAGRGETVLSHDLTDNLKQFLAQMSNIATRQPVAAPAPISVNATLNVHSVFTDRQSLRQFTEDEFAGILVDVLSKGSYRRR